MPEIGREESGADQLPRACFVSTHWSVVLAARDQASPQAAEALEKLCRTYWPPVHAYLLRQGHGRQEAEDLTQEFFARVLEKNYFANLEREGGKFRSFLLTSLKHFVANQWDRARTQKRGGGQKLISLDADEMEGGHPFEPADRETPEILFERQWALTVLEQVLARLRAEFVASEKADLFDQLKIFLTLEQPASSYAELAAKTGLKEGTLKVAVHRLRRRYGELLRAEIAQTVKDPGEVEDEVRHLIAVVGK